MTPRSVIHVDMDAFYASVEQRDDEALRGRPVIVGGNARRGVVLAASYEARRFGVRSAMPMARALQLAPKAIVVAPRFRAYAEASEQVFSIFERFTPLVEPLSLDEAFLDVTASIALFGPPAVIAQAVRDRIREETQLPASAGISCVKFVAKIASDLAKPNGQIEVPRDRVKEFLAALPVARLWGVGPKSEQVLRSLQILTIGDVAARDPEWLTGKLGDSGVHLWALSQGIDDREVTPDRTAKSIGAEDTFDQDLEIDELSSSLQAQSLRVARRLRIAHLRARVIVLKLKLNTLRVITRRSTLGEPTDDGSKIYQTALGLLTPQTTKLRLTGVSAQDLVQAGGGEQLVLFDSDARRRRGLNQTLDAIEEKFGSGAVRPAELLVNQTKQPPTRTDTRIHEDAGNSTDRTQPLRRPERGG